MSLTREDPSVEELTVEEIIDLLAAHPLERIAEALAAWSHGTVE